MKSKPILLLLALMLCVGAFAFPITAYADAPADTTPPTLTAQVTEGILHIEASDAESGVEAVFVGGARINYRVDGALDVILRDYAGTGETVELYATDFAGNKSKEVQVKNPYYVKPTPAPAQPAETPAPQPTESAVAESKPFTPAGSATTVDNATDGDGKEFFTITTPDENIFYLIVINKAVEKPTNPDPEPKPGKLLIIKKAEKSGTLLKGAVFGVYRESDGKLIKEITTDRYGEATLELALGDYYMRELEAPAGFRLDSGRLAFRIKFGETKEITIVNKAKAATTGTLLLIKKSENGKALSGAVFGIYDSTTREKLDEITTDR